MKKLALLIASLLTACASPEGRGLAPTPEGTGARVTFDINRKPLPEIPLPNDFATVVDPSSPTGHRLNVSTAAPTRWETETRKSIDQLDGWGTFQPVTVAFDKPLDVVNIVKHHQGDDYDPSDDLFYLINISPDSPDFCERVPLDMGQGNFPNTLEKPAAYPNDLHNDSEQSVFEDREEDLNHNGKLDLGEDLDMDGVLDHPNTLQPGDGRLAVMNFYERETNTLIMRPVVPLRENTTYAVVLTRRLTDEDGRPVRSPFDYINHTSQTRALEPLLSCLPKYRLEKSDLAFTWAYTTMSITRDLKTVREGLYGIGPLQRLAQEFPNTVKELMPMKQSVPGSTVNVRIVSGEEFTKVALDLLKALDGSSTLSPTYQAILDSHKFIDYHVIFSFESPQFFPRNDADGNPLPLYKQTWDLNSQTGAAFTRSETIYAWATIPKHRQGPAPAVILGHGYTGAKVDPLFYGGYFARYGVACIAIDAVSHGLGLDRTEVELARGLFGPSGLTPMFSAVVEHGRATDQNGDGRTDPGADFWTSYSFHTRDVLRQTAVDHMQLIRVLRGFDGLRTWRYDGNKDGKGDLAGDFDGDGVIDLGGNAPISMTGGSLGGIMSSILAGSEPELETAVAVSAGGGLVDVGTRSWQGTVDNAVNLRGYGPLLVTLQNAQGSLDLWEYLPNLNGLGTVKIAPVTATLAEGDTAVLWNKKTQEHRCFRVQAGGLLRAAISSDEGDELKLAVYPGPLPTEERSGCRVPQDSIASWEVDSMQFDYKWFGQAHPAGDPLVALGDGFGLRRQSPERRRFLGLGQMAIDQADPVNWIPYAERWPLHYATGEDVRTRVVVLNTIGDGWVATATGITLARAAGFLDYTTKDPRYGKTLNQVLIDTGATEGVERVSPYLSATGDTVLMDVDNFSGAAGVSDGWDMPRLSPPMRNVGKAARNGGMSGVLFPMVDPNGRHGFDLPDHSLSFDLGSYLMNMLGRYVQTQGADLPLDACMASNSCSWVPPIPPG